MPFSEYMPGVKNPTELDSSPAVYRPGVIPEKDKNYRFDPRFQEMFKPIAKAEGGINLETNTYYGITPSALDEYKRLKKRPDLGSFEKVKKNITPDDAAQIGYQAYYKPRNIEAIKDPALATHVFDSQFHGGNRLYQEAIKASSDPKFNKNKFNKDLNAQEATPFNPLQRIIESKKEFYKGNPDNEKGFERRMNIINKFISENPMYTKTGAMLQKLAEGNMDLVNEHKPEFEDLGIDPSKFTQHLTGGKADNFEDIQDLIVAELLKGVEVEHEHTTNPYIAMEIASDHLEEIPDYYSRLNAMEEEYKKNGSLTSRALLNLIQ